VSENWVENKSGALVVRGRGIENDKNKNRGKSKNRKGNCNYCRQPGHWKVDCPKLKGNKETGEEALATIVEYFEDNNYVLSVSGDCVGNSWILDSGCSQHMCPNRDWFIDYQSLDVGVVFMGNNMSSRVAGVETVKIKMFDGRVMTLTNVRHVPDLKKSLVSLGTLNSQGYRYFAEGGVLRVSKGAYVCR